MVKSNSIDPCKGCAHSRSGIDAHCEQCLNSTDPHGFPGYEPEEKPRKDPREVASFVAASVMMVLAAVISTFNATGYLDGARITAIPYWAILSGYWAIRIWRR